MYIVDIATLLGSYHNVITYTLNIKKNVYISTIHCDTRNNTTILLAYLLHSMQSDVLQGWCIKILPFDCQQGCELGQQLSLLTLVKNEQSCRNA